MDAPSLLSAFEKKLLLSLAHDAIAAQVDQHSSPTLSVFLESREDLAEGLEQDSALFQSLGVFVSLYIGGDLRGCIGSFRSDETLWRNVQNMARHAARNDPRFSPLRREELDQLSCEISVLTQPTPVTTSEEIVVGRDGLIIEDISHRGVLLPQVATKYHWTAEQFLQNTCLKASLPPHAWKEESTQILKFQAIIFSDESPIDDGA